MVFHLLLARNLYFLKDFMQPAPNPEEIREDEMLISLSDKRGVVESVRIDVKEQSEYRLKRRQQTSDFSQHVHESVPNSLT